MHLRSIASLDESMKGVLSQMPVTGECSPGSEESPFHGSGAPGPSISSP